MRGGYCSRVAGASPLLLGARLGRHASLLEECASTQEVVRAAAAGGAEEGLVAVAEHQSAGRGRLGRRWLAPPGQALLLSLLLRPRTPPERLAPLSLVAGIAVAESLPVPAGVRWPNDVVVGGAKLGGILIELDLLPDRAPAAILGVGLNVNVPAAGLPVTDRLPATSLLVELGAPVDRLGLLVTLLGRLGDAYDEFEARGFEALVERYEALDALRGHEVTLDLGAETATGIAAGVDAAGRLLLDGPAGRRALGAGEVVRVLDPAAA